jgi:hypothetical protein
MNCSCGEDLSLEESDAPVVVCPRCGKIFSRQLGDEIKDDEVIPLVESVVAKIAAWGCLFPLGFGFLVAGLLHLIEQQTTGFMAFSTTGLAAFLSFGLILSRHRYSARAFGIIGSFVLCALSGIGWHVWNTHQTSRVLDERFFNILTNSKGAIDKPVMKQMVLHSKFLPVIRTRFGEKKKSAVTHVYVELYDALPASLLAESAEEVKTVLFIDWTYEVIGHYRSTDLLKIKHENILQGGCRIKALDITSNQIVHDYHLLGPDSAPKTRSTDDTTTYYGLQPSEVEVFKYVNSLTFE